MALVGQRWQEGRWTIAEEHLASQTLARSLERIRDSRGPEGRVGPLAVLAGVAGEHHAIGLICLDQVLCAEGWTVANLGPDVPAPDLARFLARNHAELVGLAASLPERAEELRASVAAAAAVRPDDPLPIMVGGDLAHDAALMASLHVALGRDLAHGRRRVCRRAPGTPGRPTGGRGARAALTDSALGAGQPACQRRSHS